MTDRKTTVNRSEHLRVDKFVSFITILEFLFNSSNSSTTFRVCKKEWKNNGPLYVLNFTSTPPLSCCHFLLWPPLIFYLFPQAIYSTFEKRVQLDSLFPFWIPILKRALHKTNQQKKKISNGNKKFTKDIDQETCWPLTKHDRAELKWDPKNSKPSSSQSEI